MNHTTKPFTQRLVAAGHQVFWGIVWSLALGLFLLYPARWLFGEAIRPVRMAFYVAPWLLLLALPILVGAVWTRRFWLAWLATVPTLLIVLSILPSFLPKQKPTPVQGSLPLRVMTYNLHAIPEINGIVEVIRAGNADIVLIQEFSGALVSPSFHELDDLYPYRDVVEEPNYGQAAFSRYPLKRIGIDFEAGKLQKLSVETPAGSVEVWNVHPLPPFLVPPAGFDAQIDALAAEIASAKGALIVAGDFNATDQSIAYQQIRHYLESAYEEAGWGFGFSYPAPPYTFMDSNLPTGPLWRIDHIFHSRELVATDARTLSNAGGSDHFPAVATLYLTK